MINPRDVNWERINNPSQMITIFKPTPEKLDRLVERLLNDYLYMSDEERNVDTVNAYLNRYFSPFHPPINLAIFYEIANFDGLIGFTSIFPEFKCEVSFKFWNPKIWGADLAREFKNLGDLIMDEFKLKRMNSASPDRRMVKFAKLAGFKQEGARKNAFKWKDKFYPLYFLGKTKD